MRNAKLAKKNRGEDKTTFDLKLKYNEKQYCLIRPIEKSKEIGFSLSPTVN